MTNEGNELMVGYGRTVVVIAAKNARMCWAAAVRTYPGFSYQAKGGCNGMSL